MKTIIYRKLILMAVFPALLFTNTVLAEDTGVDNLSVEVRAALQKEMLFIDSAMKDILSANAAGDLEKVANIAKQIEESFILNKSLSNKQKHELHTKLPDGFLKLDQEFHYMAGMLGHVAESKKSELISFYYSKLFESCANCHKSYAKHKFKKFTGKVKINAHKH